MRKLNTLKTIQLLAILFIASITFTSCNDKEDEFENEDELITTVTYTLTNGNNIVTFVFQDLDGEGGEEGTVEVSGPLAANTTYTGSIELLNESETPAEDITEEVAEEDDEHEFFYTTTVAGLSIEKTDVDEDGNPVGIATSLVTGDAGTGTITIVLKHEPTKPNNNNSADAGGSTDVEVTFEVSVQ